MKKKLTEIKLNPNNPRQIKDEKYKKLLKSIQEFPDMLSKRPLVIDENNIILGGNMRYKACEELGYTEIDVIVADNRTEAQKKEFLIKDNLGYGERNWDDIANEWDTEQLEDWGMDLPNDFIEEEQKAEEDDYEAPTDIKTDIKRGDLITFEKDGKELHRLICGDSTSKEDIQLLMNGELADLGFNDPPYGMKKEKDGVLNDNLNYDDLLEFNKKRIARQFEVLKDNGSRYCRGIDEPLMDIYSNIIKPLIKTQKATFRNLITWDKGNGQGQNSEDFRMYPIADEKCLFVMCGVQGFNNNADNYWDEWEIIRKYIVTEFKKLGISTGKLAGILGLTETSSSVRHWVYESQRTFLPKERYYSIQSYCQQNNIAAFKKEYDELKKEYYSTRAYFDNTHDNQNNVRHFGRETEREMTGGHATLKPIALCERGIKSSCPENGLVIDFFGGSGSTMVACHQLNRRCFMQELDEKYCQVICDRMHKLDKSLTIKKNGELRIEEERDDALDNLKQ